MEDLTKIIYIKNLENFTFTSTIVLPINSSINVKNVLNVYGYIFDEKIEYSSGKALYSGKIGVKVVYIDVDNSTNTLTDSQSFSETILDPAITSESLLLVGDGNVFCNGRVEDGSIKIEAQVISHPSLYINLALPKINHNFENIVVKKNEINTTSLARTINANFEYTSTFEPKESVDKILIYNSCFIPKNITSFSEYALIEGSLESKLVYETTKDNRTMLIEETFTNPVKNELSIHGLTQEEQLDLIFKMQYNMEELSKETEDNLNVIIAKHTINIQGVAIKNISIEVVDDIFSTTNELDQTVCTREYCVPNNCLYQKHNIIGNVELLEDEPSINEVTTVVSTSAQISNAYVKENTLFVEGFIVSTLIYTNDLNELNSKYTETPFAINTNIETEKLDFYHISATAIPTKARAKRSNMIETEYQLNLDICINVKKSVELVDGFTIGAPLDFSKYDYQIFLAKPNETLWELCKRTKIHPDQILEYNANLPPVCVGGERIIVKR